MADEVRRIQLPSGGWWELFTRPRWRHVRRWRLQDPNGGSVSPESALASLTKGWSFAEEVSAESVADLEEADLVVALEVFQREVVPFLKEADQEEPAQGLFKGLLKGKIPLAFEEVHLMAVTGWSGHALQETPADVVRMMATYYAVRQAVEQGASVDFRDEEAQQDDG